MMAFELRLATTNAVVRIHDKQHREDHGDLYKKWLAEAKHQELSSWLRRYDPGTEAEKRNVDYSSIAQHISSLHHALLGDHYRNLKP